MFVIGLCRPGAMQDAMNVCMYVRGKYRDFVHLQNGIYTHTHTDTHIRTRCTKWITGAVPLCYQAVHVLHSAIKASRENTPCNLWLADPSARVAFYSGVLDSRIYREYSGKKACIFSTRDYISSLAPPSREREILVCGYASSRASFEN